MEMAAAAAAAAMDFHALSRRELQALCKRNGVRANMTNAAMADALQGLPSVDGIDEIGTTLCLPTPGRSAMKSVEMAGEEQQHGSPLPRGRRVSVKSPEAIRMEVEEGEDEVKRDLGKEIVRTPGVALRSSSRRARATPAPLPPTPMPASSARATARRAAVRKTEEVAPTPATLRRSQRSSVRKGAAPVVVDPSADDVSAAKRTTRSARSKVTIALEQEDEVAVVVDPPAPKEEKVLQEEPQAIASDVKCDDPEEEEVTKLLEGNNKEDEPEEGEEAVVDAVSSTCVADSSDAKIGSAVTLDKSCHDPQVEEVAVVMEEQSTKPHEGIVEEHEPISVEKSASLTVMEDSPILGLLSKVETEGPAVEMEHVSSVEDGEGLADEIIPDIEDKEVAVDEEAVKEAGFAVTGDTNPTTEEIVPIAVEVETSEDDGLTEAKEGAADKMPQAELADDQTNEEVDEDDHSAVPAHEVPQAELADDETSEQDDNTELKESAAVKMEQAELIEEDISEEEDHTELKDDHSVKMPPAQLIEEDIMKEDDLDDEEEWASEDDNDFDEIGSSDESDEETEASEQSYTGDVVQMPQGTEEDNEDASTEDDDFSGDLPSESDEETETSEQSYTGDVVQMPQGTVQAVEENEDASTEDDDFSGDLPPEFDNIQIYSDDETESDIAPPVLDENQAAVMSLDDSSTNVEQQQEVPEEADATEKELKEVDNIVKSLDEFSFKEKEAKEMTKQPQTENLKGMSLRKLKTELKNRLIALKETKEEVTEGKRLPLEEVDGNAGVDF
ncbi:hypothetical protein U9M48_022292 [Paspalum notatum var. saurae]|uniref:Uncharacterized protein n=1 Tax=Paspalum notatum var. saurae TaxID=547442 RepID=A0AAQ3WUM0_PASNO